MGYTIAPQFICHDLSGFIAVRLDQALEEALCSGTIPPGLEKYIDYLAVLIHGSPEILLLAIDLDEDFVNVEGIAVALVPTLQPPGISGPELDTPQPDSFVADCYPTLGQQIFNIAVTEVEPVIEPDCITDDFGRESVSFISIHPPDYRILDVKLSIPLLGLLSLTRTDQDELKLATL